ncbi:hypothetical protein QFC24_001248 [Naganishia onofrii]|uniref:Uncharacterized protein n=1 Tax=Naganishia onofrii TaxID=1851511 RepID=A0ACC2XUU2_9TREE|nr:hypothetical protein QFC24_001248 [Naganishia onofrii]
MATPSPSPKKSRKISQVINDNPLHNLYQVMYNPTADQTEIPRHAFHCFLNGKGDYLKIRLYALVDLKEGSSEEQEQAIAIEEITAVEKLAQSIILGEMHTSGNQKKFRKQDPDEIKASIHYG